MVIGLWKHKKSKCRTLGVYAPSLERAVVHFKTFYIKEEM